ncbi:hypothetical protein KXD40_005235 [Peronospora effusa]|uniref:Reverse transcriptase RNase H-like domain-containing protein n=1 Tax=Peronospora effusa TaxID=542832 RepID=A0A3M6VBN7_9STRA|nr:hypothetical protein DD238_008133 [Peronospora effusa]RQM12262.1 hypothetical protein DD237_008225 [Peronospora effusa]UIZ22208.1 hypothetical protein KXD40_005235 [Peronospora effusa]
MIPRFMLSAMRVTYFAIGCELMQHDGNGNERVVSYQSRQLKPAERNYPVDDKEPLAMRYAFVKFRLNFLESRHSSSTSIMRPYEPRLRARTSASALCAGCYFWLSTTLGYITRLDQQTLSKMLYAETRL